MTSAWETLKENIRDELRKSYSETVVDHALNPRNVGNKSDADGCSITIAAGDCPLSRSAW